MKKRKISAATTTLDNGQIMTNIGRLLELANDGIIKLEESKKSDGTYRKFTDNRGVLATSFAPLGRNHDLWGEFFIKRDAEPLNE